MDEEESFPRGGGKAASSEKKREASKSGEPAAKKKYVAKNVDFDPFVEDVQPLTYKYLTEGMVVFGCVVEVKDAEVRVGLPNALMGVIPITGVSRDYTRHLKSFGSESEDVDIATLEDFLSVGDYVKCAVASVSHEEEDKRVSFLKLTLDPAAVNSDLTSKAVKPGMVVQGSVSSHEDKGYAVELGISGLTAFCPTSEGTETHSKFRTEEEGLPEGLVLQWVVKNVSGGERRSVVLSLKSDALHKAQTKVLSEAPVNHLQPGVISSCTVTKVTSEGLLVSCGQAKGRIHHTHLLKPPEKFSVEETVTSCILAVHPATKFLTCSLLPHLVTKSSVFSDRLDTLSVGSTVEEAEVKEVLSKRGVLFRIRTEHGVILGFTPLKLLMDIELTKVPKKFAVGSKHRARVVNIDYMDQRLRLTTKPSILEQKYLVYEDIELGAFMKCKVSRLIKSGAVVTSGQFRGFIPLLHLADVPLKHPEQKFTPGTPVTCRVLSVNPEEQKLQLTAKKSLVQSKDTPLTLFSDARPGALYTGYIGKISGNGVLVAFYGGVKGWVAKDQLSRERVDRPEQVFYRGQVVRARALGVKPHQQRLNLSFIISGDGATDDALSLMESVVPVGKVVSCQVTGKTNQGLTVKLPEYDNATASLPTVHLSDHLSLCQALWDTYHDGDVIEKCAVFSTGGSITLSLRESVVSAAEENRLPSDFDDLQVGSAVPVSVRAVQSYGVFLETSGGCLGLAPLKFLSEQRLEMSKHEHLFPAGKSLVATVMEKDEEKNRGLFSLRAKDCRPAAGEVNPRLLGSQFVKTQLKIRKHFAAARGVYRKLTSYCPGDVITATVVGVTGSDVTCVMKDGIKVVVTAGTGDAVPNVGDTVKCTVLLVDFSSKVLLASLNSSLVKAASKVKSTSKAAKVKKGQVLKTEVLLITEDVVVVSLRGHALGRVGILPARTAGWDLLERYKFVVGQTNHALVTRVLKDGTILLSLQLHETGKRGRGERNIAELSDGEEQEGDDDEEEDEDDEDEDEDESGEADQDEEEEGESEGDESAGEEDDDSRDDPAAVGKIVDAVIERVTPLQLNVKLGSVKGRVHVTEASDNPRTRETLQNRFRAGQNVRVRILGYRDIGRAKYLPITRPGSGCLAECTLRESKLKKKRTSLALPTFSTGDSINVYVSEVRNNHLLMHVTPSLRARVPLIYVTNVPKFLAKPEKYFKRGQCYPAHVTQEKGDEDKWLELSLVGAAPGDLSTGLRTICQVKGIADGEGVRVDLRGRNRGYVDLTEIEDSYDKVTSKVKAGSYRECIVLKRRTLKGPWPVSLRPTRLGRNSNVQDKLINDLGDVVKGQSLRGFVKDASPKGVSVRLGYSIVGTVELSRLDPKCAKHPEKHYSVGELVQVFVVSVDKGRGKVELTFTPTKAQKAEQAQREVGRKRRLSSCSVDGEESGKDKKRKSETPKGEEQSDSLPESPTKGAPKLQSLGDDLGFDLDTSWKGFPAEPRSIVKDTSEEEDEGDTTGKTKKKNKGDVKRVAQQREMDIRAAEAALADPDRAPETADDFDRLVAQSPDSSLVWLRYMAHLIQEAELDRARSVAERALTTINFKEEGEKYNVWAAYLSLEVSYGSDEAVETLSKRAAQNCDSLKIQRHLAKLLENASKTQAAEELHGKLTKRHRQDPDVWMDFMSFLYATDKAQAARDTLQRSLKALEKRHHVTIAGRVARLEWVHGSRELSKTMFEGVLTSCPNRLDIWNVYTDLHVKSGDIEGARQVLERAVTMKMSGKRLKSLLKRWLTLERDHGTPETVAKVLESAKTAAQQLDAQDED